MAAQVLPTLSGESDFEALYDALRMRARYYLRREQNACSMSPTILVHEAWISLSKSRAQRIVDAAHYARLVSRVMRNLLVDHARRKNAIAHGGALRRVEWDETLPASAGSSHTTLAVAAALEKLALLSPQLAEIVELRYFAGFTEDEVAQVMGLSSRSVRRQWQAARSLLLGTLKSPVAEVRGATE